MNETFMNKEIIEAGTSPTAPSTATATAATVKASVTPVKTKVMVLAVHQDADGKLLLTPIDVEHVSDDQRDLSPAEMTTGANALVAYRKNEDAMKLAFEALYTLFSQRLYREKFRTFENFCFALFGTHRIDDTIAARAKARINRYKAALQEDAQ